MKCIKKIVFGLAVGAALVASAKGPKGSYAERPLSLKASQSVKLMNEWVPGEDGEKGEYSGVGVAYYSVTLKRGQAYTIWIEGDDADEIDFDVDIDPKYDGDKYDKEKNEGKVPGAGFDIEDVEGGNVRVAYLYADDWDLEEDGDPKSGDYIVALAGDIGQTTTLHFTTGIRNFTVTGTEDSPKVITFKDGKELSFSAKTIEDSYYFRASLKAGRRYLVRTEKGTTSLPLDLDVSDGSGSDDDENESSDVFDNPDFINDSRYSKGQNAALVVTPETSGKYTFAVFGNTSVTASGKEVAQSFTFKYKAIPTRAISAHPAIPLRVEALGNEEDGYSVKFVPGHRTSSNSYYDSIIDEHLCKIYLNKGERWVFETSGASQEQEMVAYDSKGKVLATNTYSGDDGYNTRVVVTATTAGLYYVGVCDPTLEVGDTPQGSEITLTARNTANIHEKDGYDPVDDVYTGATPLVAFPATTNELRVADVVASNNVADLDWIFTAGGTHSLRANDLYDWFVLPCRSGFRYRLRAAFVDENMGVTNLNLAAVTYYYASGVRKTAATIGTISPVTVYTEMEDDYTFTATANGPHYIRVSVAEGLGLDFPDYRIYAVVDNGTNELGLVKCDIEGGVGTWSYNEETAKYASGAIVAVKPTDDNPYKTGDKLSFSYAKYKTYDASGLPSGWTWNKTTGKLTGTAKSTFKVTFKKTGKTTATETITISEKPIVRFSAVSGYSPTPGNILTNVPAWHPDEKPNTLSARYADIYDAKYVMSYTTKTTSKNGKKTTTKTPNYSPADGDATPAGAFAITSANKAATLKRTLWADDPADCYSFTAAAGVYYNFTVTSASSNLTMVVSNSVTGATVAGTPLADGTGVELPKQLLEAGKTFLIVSHGDAEDKEATYSLTYSKASPGIVRFTNAKAAATTSFSVKEGAEYATLYVARTGTEGAMRVKYATQAGTAQPGTNYYPVTDGEVSWKAGDKAAKAIKIRMIPDLYAHWASSNLTFSVKLFPVDEFDTAYEDNADEYLARTNTPQVATVTITEATAKQPGTISIVSYDAGAGAVDVANVKKPAAVGIAGADDATNTLVLAIARTGGADGRVSVKVATSTANGDTAKANADYVAKTETFVWEDGEDDTKLFAIELPPVAGYTASKKFTVTMAVVNTGFTPTLSAKTAVVTVKNATVDQTAAAYVKALGSAGLAFASTGTWFEDYDGTLRSAPAAGTATFTLTGPGFVQFRPVVVKPITDPGDGEVASAATLTCQFDKEPAIDCAADDFEGTVARVIASGKHTVKFTLSGVAGGAYVKFENAPDGKPYLWVPLSGLAPFDPMNKAVVLTNQTTLAWSLPEGIVGREGIYNRVRFGTTAKTMAPIANVTSADSLADVPGPLAAGATYYWAVDTAYTNATGLADEDIAALKFVNGTTWTFSVLKDGAPVTVIMPECRDASGESILDRMVAGEPVELLQGVKPDLGLDGDGEGENPLAATGFRLVGGALPKGVSINATTGKLTGAPSTPGDYRALLQSYSKVGKTVTKKVNGKNKKVTTYTTTYGSTVAVPFKVLPAGTSLGSFRGYVLEDGGTFTNDSRGVGDVTLSVTSAGKLTAKVTIAGIAYTFTGTGYDEVLSYYSVAAGTTRELQATLSNTITVNKKKYTNKLTLTMNDGALTDTVALAEKLGSVRIDNMKVLNAKKTAFTSDVSYEGDLYRNNGGTEAGKASVADFTGYYTVALVPEAVSAADGVPVGNGYLLLTVAEANTVKVTGALADGTAVSVSTIGQLVGDDIGDPRACVLNVPVCVSKAAYVLAGVVQIAYPDGAAEDALPVARPASKLLWVKNKATATSRDGSGFTIEQAPTGGWYDKVVNLQAYYLGKEFAIYGADAGEDLPTEALASTYAFATESTPQNLAVKFTGNAMAVTARKLVTNKTLGLYDFVDGVETTSVNPWNVTVKFTRATGLVTGTFSAWEWKYRTVNGYAYPTAQKQISKLTHKGVLLFSRDESSDSPLRGDALTAGFFLMPATTSTKASDIKKAWKASLPFNIVTTADDEPTWDERDFDTEDPE